MIQFLRSWQGIAVMIAVLAVLFGGLAWWLTRPPPVVDPLAEIKSKGTITIGVRSGMAPFSSLDSAKAFVGFEPDVAKAIAAALKVRPRFVAVDDTNAFDYLKRGIVDLVIMPRSGPEMRDVALRSVEPGYFASGFNAVTLRETSLRHWDDLKGENVCGLQSSTAAKQIIDELGGSFIGFSDRDTAFQALAADRCKAFINDEVALSSALKSDVDRRFTLAFETIDPTPWTITVRAGEAALGDFVADELTEFHRTGFLIERARVWQLRANPYLESMRQYYKQ